VGSGARGRIWDWLAGIAGLVLLISLFLHWFSSNRETPTGIDALGLTGYLLFFIALFAMAAPVVSTLRQTPREASRYTLTLLAFAVVGLILAIIRTNDPPEFDTVEAAVSVEAGAYIGCVAVGLIAVFATVAIVTRKAKHPASSTAQA
jgi:drug/metabolite transporter (DMT)-like permease